jgi:hypothetical protein
MFCHALQGYSSRAGIGAPEGAQEAAATSGGIRSS